MVGHSQFFRRLLADCVKMRNCTCVSMRMDGSGVLTHVTEQQQKRMDKEEKMARGEMEVA